MKKKNEIMLFVTTGMDLEIIALWSKSERERQIPYDIIYLYTCIYTSYIWYIHIYLYIIHIYTCIYGINTWHKWTYLWNRNKHRHKEQTCGYQGEGELGRDGSVVGLADANYYT